MKLLVDLLDKALSLIPFNGQKALISALAIVIVDRLGLDPDQRANMELLLGSFLALALSHKAIKSINK